MWNFSAAILRKRKQITFTLDIIVMRFTIYGNEKSYNDNNVIDLPICPEMFPP